MVTYYRDAEVLVTDAEFVADGQRYRLAELDRVWHVAGPRSWRTTARRGAIGLGMLAWTGVRALAKRQGPQ